jgi:predicted acyl esterase
MPSEEIVSTREVRLGMLIDWDVPIAMDDGVVLRSDVFRPNDNDRYPVILSYGPYAKGLSFQEGYAPQWAKLVEDFPEVLEGSTNEFQNWEVVDPERWVPDGYACVRVDSRGSGRSAGCLDLWSQREADDLYQCIEWAAQQQWSTGRIGLSGISYYAMNQYQVAARLPPHLAAIVAWEGASDWYRELSHHGGILCEFVARWFPVQVSTVQHGVGERGARSRSTGELVAGPSTLDEEQLSRNRVDLAAELKARPLLDAWYQDRNPDWSRVSVPMLSAGNWGGQNLHLRGDVEAFTSAASEQKWLEIHGNGHWAHFYTDYGIGLQKRFLGYFLKGQDTGWEHQPRVLLQVRHIPERYVERHAEAWPLPDTRWTSFRLHPQGMRLDERPLAAEVPLEYDPMGPGLTFESDPVPEPTEITGPMAARLYISSETTDADLFLVFRVFDPQGAEITFQGAVDPNTPISQGWLRASHRKLDPVRSRPERPYHTHDELQPLTPGEVYQLEIEIWPSCIVVPSGYRFALTVRGNDYRYEGELSEFARTFHYANRGVGPYTHADPDDRPEDVFGGRVTLHTGGKRDSWLLLPIIPAAGA